jgi:MFS family permease
MAPVLALISAASVICYVKRARIFPAPLVPLRLFSVRTFSTGICGNLFARLGFGAMPFLLPLLFQVNMKYSPLEAGLMLLPPSIAAVLAKQPAVHLISRYGYRGMLISNTVILAAIIVCFAFISQSTPLWLVLSALFCFGAVSSVQYTAMNTVTLKDLTEDVAASGNSMLSMIQMLSVGAAAAIASVTLDLAGSILGTGDSSFMFCATFIFIAMITFLSAIIFARLEANRKSGILL